MSRVEVGAPPLRRLWRPGPDAAEREARTLGPRLATGRQPAARAERTATARPLRAQVAPRPAGTLGSGRPLAPAERRRFEPVLGVDLADVRVHDGAASRRAAAARHAHAFTVGNHVVLGRAAQHGGPGGRAAVLAHELVHVRQQAVPAQAPGSSRARGPPPTVRVQCWDADDLVPGFVSDAAGAVVEAGSAAVEGVAEAGEAAFDWVLDGVRDAARNLPGYDLLRTIVGRDPLTGEQVAVERSELVEAILTHGPFGPAVASVLQAADVLGDVVTTLTEGLVAHGLTLQRVLSDVDAAFAEFTLSNGIDANLAIVRRYVSAFLADVLAFVQQIAARVIEIVRAVAADLAEPLLQAEPIGPVWQLTTQVLHYDTLRGLPVQTPTVEILANFLRLIGKQDALAQMQERGTLQATADWLDTQLATFAGLIGQLGTLFSSAWAAIQPENLPRLLDTLPALAQQAFALVQGVASFAVTVIAKVLELVKASLLAWLSDYANQVPGFPMITVIIGQNPFTGEVVPRTAENLIRGFITLLPGGAAMYDSLAESGVIASAAERIEGAMVSLGITSEMVLRTFLGVWDLVTLESLITPLTTFAQVVALFGDPVRRIVEFVTVVVEVVVTLVLRLMSFPTELLGSIIANTVAAIADIKRDPVGFLLNMVEALKAGFLGFFANIATHLTQGLMDWLFRGLGELGITIPTQWSLGAALDLVLQVLGLSVEFLWRKLGEHIGEERVALIRENLDRLSGAWAFVTDVQQRGLAAIWDFVANQLSNLWQTVLSMATEWIMTRVIATATTRLLSMLDPTGVMAVVNSCIAFFNAVQSAIEYLRDMLEIVGMYVSTLAAVAAGNIEPGARMIEQGLAAVIPIAIGFLARQVGLGNMPERIVEIIGRLREMVESAIDWLIAQALRLGRAALDALGLGRGDAGAAAEPSAGAGSEGSAPDVLGLAAAALDARLGDHVTEPAVSAALPGILSELSPVGLHALRIEHRDDRPVVVAEASPVTVLADLSAVPERAQMYARTRITFDAADGGSAGSLGAVEEQVRTSAEGESFSFQLRDEHHGAAVRPRARGGAVFRPEGAGEVDVLNWNSSDNMSRSSNSDHAEHHLVVWFRSIRERWPDVRAIAVVNDPYSPCTECASELEGMARDITRAREAAGRPPVVATLRWERVWGGRAANRTQPQTLPGMNHWVVTPRQLPATGVGDYDQQLELHMLYRERRDAAAAAAGPVPPVIRRRR